MGITGAFIVPAENDNGRRMINFFAERVCMDNILRGVSEEV